MSLKLRFAVLFWVMKMQCYTVLDGSFERESDGDGYIKVLDETCRILNGLKMCSRYCATCAIACSISKMTLEAGRERVETWNFSPVVVRR